MDPNLHGVWCGNDDATACGIPVNTWTKNSTSGGEEGGNMTYCLSGEKSLTHDVVTCHKVEGALSAATVGKEHGIGLLCDRVVKGMTSSGAKVATVESHECTYCLNSAGTGASLS